MFIFIFYFYILKLINTNARGTKQKFRRALPPGDAVAVFAIDALKVAFMHGIDGIARIYQSQEFDRIYGS